MSTAPRLALTEPASTGGWATATADEAAEEVAAATIAAAATAAASPVVTGLDPARPEVLGSAAFS